MEQREGGASGRPAHTHPEQPILPLSDHSHCESCISSPLMGHFISTPPQSNEPNETQSKLVNWKVCQDLQAVFHWTDEPQTYTNHQFFSSCPSLIITIHWSSLFSNHCRDVFSISWAIQSCYTFLSYIWKHPDKNDNEMSPAIYTSVICNWQENDGKSQDNEIDHGWLKTEDV